MSIIKINSKYRIQINAIIKEQWAGPYVVSRGNLIDTRQLPGYIYLHRGTMAGYILYEIRGIECEIVLLHSLVQNTGGGSALIHNVLDEAHKLGCRRVWLITTNDNTRAIRYYQKRGFALKAVYINAMLKTRELKPGLPETGIDGIPLLHEFEFEIII